VIGAFMADVPILVVLLFVAAALWVASSLGDHHDGDGG